MVNIILLRINALEVKGVAVGGEEISEELISDIFPMSTVEDILSVEELLKSNVDSSKQLVSICLLITCFY